jgi:hypothetical protein
MKTIFESTDITDSHIQIVTVLRLNHQERRRFAQHFESFGADGFVILPFYGMNVTTLDDLLATGEIELDQWTEKDRFYTTDEAELSMLESMMCDDIAAVRRLAGVTEKASRPVMAWVGW